MSTLVLHVHGCRRESNSVSACKKVANCVITRVFLPTFIESPPILLDPPDPENEMQEEEDQSSEQALEDTCAKVGLWKSSFVARLLTSVVLPH